MLFALRQLFQSKKTDASLYRVLCLVLLVFLLVPLPADAKPDRPMIFGTVELRSKLSSLKQWGRVCKQHEANSLFIPNEMLKGSLSWDKFKASLEPLSDLDKIRKVNTFWNSWPYREDTTVYNLKDFWATPRQFAKNSGDCEDYCIAKYFTLRELGFPADKMRIIIVTETIRDLAHAILAVYLDDKVYILDNLSRNVLEQSRLKNYKPHYSFNEDNRWLHFKAKKKKSSNNQKMMYG